MDASKSSPSVTNSNMIEDVDRISKLPIELIHHILSFVDTKYVVQTCVLSKRWIHIWKSLPFLNFQIYGRNVDTLKINEFFDKFLLHRDGSNIQRFTLTWDSYRVLIRSVNRWIDAAVKHNVQEVTIELCQYHEGFTYEISPSVLNCKSLKKLTLRVYCDDGVQYADVILPKSMSLPQLKFMRLDGFLVYDLDSSKRLFSCCPVLETLNIVNCDIKTDHQGTFTVESLSLKQFSYTYARGSGHSKYYRKPKVIRLYAPNLKNFTCESNWKHEYHLQNCSDQLSHVNFNIIYNYVYDSKPLEENEMYARRMVKLLAAVDKVKRLHLSSGFLEVLSKATYFANCELPCLCNLESLRLETWFTRDSLRALSYLLKISPNIKTLILIHKPSLMSSYERGLLEMNLVNIGNDWEVEISLPGMLSQLNSIRIENAEGCAAEIKFMSFLLKIAKCLEEVALRPCSTVPIPRLRKKYKDKLRAHRKSISPHQSDAGSNRKYPYVRIY